MKLPRLLLLVAWMFVIYFFSDQPNSNEVTQQYFGGFNFWVRKLAHLTEYAILYLLFHWNLSAKRSAVVLSLAGVLVYAILDEWHQSVVPGRSAAVGDVLIDMAGAGLGALAVTISGVIRSKRSLS